MERLIQFKTNSHRIQLDIYTIDFIHRYYRPSIINGNLPYAPDNPNFDEIEINHIYIYDKYDNPKEIQLEDVESLIGLIIYDTCLDHGKDNI